MISETTVLSARRAYEFRPDELRLTVLSMTPLLGLMQQAFQFQIAQVASPLPTFGEVPSTIPPSVVFDYGMWSDTEGGATPIRFVHFEPRRIVVDVAGPSVYITPIYERIHELVRQVIDTLQVVGERPAIGNPEHALDYSEIVFKASWSLEALFPRKVRTLLNRASGVSRAGAAQMFVPTLYGQLLESDDQSPGGIIMPNSRTVQLASRSGTGLNERVHYSGALLDSDAHLEYLQELDALVGER
jgi:hypothetical protein